MKYTFTKFYKMALSIINTGREHLIWTRLIQSST